jgi:ribose 5-phosphate isomerase A
MAAPTLCSRDAWHALDVPQVQADARMRARDAAAAAAVDYVEPGMTIGLGSGRAVLRVIDYIEQRFGTQPPLRATFASETTRDRAEAFGIQPIDLTGDTSLDVAIDGADEIDANLDVIKGGGAALLREKLVISAAERFICVADTLKQVDRLGLTRPLPVEVVRFGWRDTRKRLLELMPGAELRTFGTGGVVVTEEGHFLLDCTLPPDADIRGLADAIKGTVGVVEHGLFIDMVDAALLGTPDGDVERLTNE